MAVYRHLSLHRLLSLLLTALVLAAPAACKPIDGAASGPDTAPNDSNDNRPTVTVDGGILAGTTTDVPWALSSATTISKFLGIRYAAPPLRFQPPQPARAWDGVYDASEFRATCIQQFSVSTREQYMKYFNTPPPPTIEAEDCLFLNVWAPAGAGTGDEPKKPVMLWFYGGGYNFGSGALPLYDGTSFAANQDIVLVTFNYRTNIFGFPGAPDIPLDKRNLGLLDQRLALDWVHRNIHAFGGDPDRVTIFGESAGGGSVDALITAPPKPVPFVGAIMQSAASADGKGDNDSATSWRRTVSAANCAQANGFDCLRAVPASFLKNLIEKEELSFQPTPDGGVTLADRPRRERFRSEEGDDTIARVPLLIGTNADEGSLYVKSGFDVEGYLNSLLLPQTPVSSLITPDGGTRNEQLSTLFTKLAMQCPAARTAKDSAEADIPTWRYLYDASFPNTELFPGSGAYHSAEISTLFGTFPAKGVTAFQLKLSRYMQKAWADFAKNPAGGPGWSQLPQVAVLGDGARPGASDEGREVAALKSQGQIDPNCGFYRLLYAILEPFV